MVDPVEPPSEEEVVPPEGDVFGERKVPATKEEPKEKKETSSIRETVEAKEPRDKAFVKDQMERYPDSVVPGNVKTVILDLADEKALEQYSEFKTNSMDPDLGLTITYEDLQYNQNSANWKVLLHILYYKFYPVA